MEKISEVLIYESKDGLAEVEVKLNNETVWLSLDEMSHLFERDRSVIGKHIRNIFKEEELLKEAVWAKYAHTANDGKTYNVDYYNLDVIISVGYRVKSKRGTQFRIWANKVLKDYMIKGYAINQKQLQIPNLEEIVELLEHSKQLKGELILSGNDMLEFLKSYNRGLKILDDYDHQCLTTTHNSDSIHVITYEECNEVIEKTVFVDKGDLFGIEKDGSFKSAIATIYQSFGGIEMYPSLEDKAANLLYFITKNHAYADGNKRIAATIFLYFLERNNALHNRGIPVISNETLATLTILVAASNPNDKESIVNLVKVIISKKV